MAKEEDLGSSEVTVYVELVSPQRTLKSKPTVSNRGPFFFNLTSTFHEFLQSLVLCTTGLPSVGAIAKVHLTWKLAVPANDRSKPLYDDSGFRALVKRVKEVLDKKKDCAIVVSLPPPSKVPKHVSTFPFFRNVVLI